MEKDSDIDIIVEMIPESDPLDYFDLQEDLKEATGKEIDLITYYALERSKESFKRQVKLEERVCEI